MFLLQNKLPLLQQPAEMYHKMQILFALLKGLSRCGDEIILTDFCTGTGTVCISLHPQTLDMEKLKAWEGVRMKHGAHQLPGKVLQNMDYYKRSVSEPKHSEKGLRLK